MMTKPRHRGILVHLKETPPRESKSATAVDPGASDSKGGLPEVAHVILGYVAMYPGGVHGYQLGRTLSKPPLRVPSLRLGHLYRVLRRLQGAGLLACTVEAESARLRYRFSITPDGAAAFGEWLRRVPQGAGIIRDHVLERLRFADRMSRHDVLRLIDEAVRACESELKELGQYGRADDEACVEHGARIYLMARKARLADDRCWLEEVRRLVERSGRDSPNAAADEPTSE